VVEGVVSLGRCHGGRLLSVRAVGTTPGVDGGGDVKVSEVAVGEARIWRQKEKVSTCRTGSR